MGSTTRIDPLVYRAPRTGADPENGHKWPSIHDRIVRRLERRLGYPWSNHLILGAAILSANRMDLHTIEGRMASCHARLRTFFEVLSLRSMDDWKPKETMIAYLKGELVPDDTDQSRYGFWLSYKSLARYGNQWLQTLSAQQQEKYRPFIFPLIPFEEVRGLRDFEQMRQLARKRRKAETDAIVRQYAQIRAEAHFRLNLITRIRQAMKEAVERAPHDATGEPVFPIAFHYQEGDETLRFRVWDKRSIRLTYPDTFRVEVRRRAHKQRWEFARGNNYLILEFVQAERTGAATPEGLWFVDLIKQKVLGSQRQIKEEEKELRRRWFAAWGYSRDPKLYSPEPFGTYVAGVLTPTIQQGGGHHLVWLMEKTGKILIPLESLYVASLFGLLALDLWTTTGMRINESCQVRLSSDCLARLIFPAPPGAKDQSPRMRYVLQLVPKGERTNTPQNYFIGEETRRLLVKVAKMLTEHYGLKAGQPLPRVPYNKHLARAHRFGKAPYIFQYSSKHLDYKTLTSCVRFLLHGIPLSTVDGTRVVLRPHLFRHAFATHAVQVEKLPIDIVREMLKQKNLAVTDYYSKPTETFLVDASDQYLAKLASHLNVGKAVVRLPEDLKALYEEAHDKVGTLTDVIGGICVSHGFCTAKFACVGCPGKVPDPSRRHQVQHKRQWALRQIAFTKTEGLLAESQRMQQLVRECERELQEMTLIEEYRKDESRVPLIQIDEQPTKR